MVVQFRIFMQSAPVDTGKRNDVRNGYRYDVVAGGFHFGLYPACAAGSPIVYMGVRILQETTGVGVPAKR